MGDFSEVAAARTRKERLVFYIAATVIGVTFLCTVVGLLAHEMARRG